MIISSFQNVVDRIDFRFPYGCKGLLSGRTFRDSTAFLPAFEGVTLPMGILDRQLVFDGIGDRVGRIVLSAVQHILDRIGFSFPACGESLFACAALRDAVSFLPSLEYISCPGRIQDGDIIFRGIGDRIGWMIRATVQYILNRIGLCLPFRCKGLLSGRAF